MKKKKPYEAAEIEAWEEVGVRGVARKKPVGRYTYLKWLENGHVAPCVVEVFQSPRPRGRLQGTRTAPDRLGLTRRGSPPRSLLVNFKPKTKG